MKINNKKLLNHQYLQFHYDQYPVTVTYHEQLFHHLAYSVETHVIEDVIHAHHIYYDGIHHANHH